MYQQKWLEKCNNDDELTLSVYHVVCKQTQRKKIRNLLSDLGASFQRDHLPLLLEGYSQFREILLSVGGVSCQGDRFTFVLNG